jgi:hypothetical protein
MKRQILHALTCLSFLFLCSEVSAFGDSLSIRVYLEGSLMNFGSNYHQGRPLMRDNLRRNPTTGDRYIPGKSPYTNNSFYVTRPNRYRTVGLQNDIVVDSTLIFSILGQDAIVDWVFVEIRSKSNVNQVVGTRSGLLQRDGDVVDVDGYSRLQFNSLPDDQGYIVVKHRNHLAVMSWLVDLDAVCDFTDPTYPVFDFGQTYEDIDYTGYAQNGRVKTGFRAMWSGDFNSDGRIKSGNPHDDMNALFSGVYLHPDNTTRSTNFNFAYGYLPMDYNLDGKVKFDNPNDDKNMQFSQTVNYPLNKLALENFGRFIEQVPTATQW